MEKDLNALNSRKGVLLVNLGTPKSPDIADVRRYLIEFLTDPRVIDLKKWQRHLLVRGIIVPKRVKESAKQYRSIWMKEGSPLRVHSEILARKLQDQLGESFCVALAMRYGGPTIEEVLNQLLNESLSELVIIPLFPHYCSATTGSVFEEVMRCLQKKAVFPRLAFVPDYFAHPKFIEAFCDRAKPYRIDTFDHVLFSFHGVPKRRISKEGGSINCFSSGCCEVITGCNRFCYKAQCVATAQALAHRLNLSKEKYTIAFQSRLGKEEWISPYTSETIEKLAKNGCRRLLVFTPSFVSDCLETTYEIGHEAASIFKANGGAELQLVGGLNDHPLWIEALCELAGGTK